MKRKPTSKAKSRRAAAASAPAPTASSGAAKTATAGWPPMNPTEMFNPMKAIKGLTDQMNNGGMGVATRYGKTIAEGYKDLGDELATFTQTSLEKQMKNATTLMTCKSVTEALTKQSEMAKSAYDDLMAAYAKLSEMSMKLAQTAMSEVGQGKKSGGD
ncbi:MAG: phasin family protein [Rhodospirillaceae bacterium]|nr:phasin family protein [Rhodospirillaceae bacterium]